MQESGPHTQDLLEQARVELVALEGRVEALRSLLERAVQAQAAADGPIDETVSFLDADRISQTRSMVSHMALSGHPRWSAEDRLSATVDRGALTEILDEVYGPKRQAG